MSVPVSLANRLAAVLKPVSDARGLPNEHYTRSEYFLAEKHDVLMPNWVGVAFAKDVPAPGDVKPIEFLGIPLLLVREDNHTVSVYQNTCRHRGMILVDKPTHVRKVIRCPYHSWCYGLDGSLKATPHVGGPGCNVHEKIPREELGLFRVRCSVWRDVVFVNFSGDATPFETYAADLIDRWAEFEQPIYHGGAQSSIRFDVGTNWKLAVENFCESYHLPWIHPGLNSYSRLQDHYNIEAPGRFSGQGTRVYRQLKDKDGNTLKNFSGLSAKWNEGAEYIALYPNVLLGVQRDHAFAIVLEPVSSERTVEHIELYYATPPIDPHRLTDADTTEAGRVRLRHRNRELWHAVFSEDLFVVEGMQRGRHGPLFDGGRFSPVMDSPTHCFHHWIASQYNRQDNVAQPSAQAL